MFSARSSLHYALTQISQPVWIPSTRPIQKPFDREAARQAVEDIKKMRKGMHIDDATIKELINEGRR